MQDDKLYDIQTVDFENFDFDALEVSDFVDESHLADGEVISNVMAASCTTCECCCSCSSS